MFFDLSLQDLRERSFESDVLVIRVLSTSSLWIKAAVPLFRGLDALNEFYFFLSVIKDHGHLFYMLLDNILFSILPRSILYHIPPMVANEAIVVSFNIPDGLIGSVKSFIKGVVLLELFIPH